MSAEAWTILGSRAKSAAGRRRSSFGRGRSCEASIQTVPYGDFFLFNDVDPKFGIVNAYPIPISEMERGEGFDPDNPGAVRFRWITQGNTVLENWQISHLRLFRK